MKHAILIIGSENPEGITRLVNTMKDDDVYFYVHWDASSKRDLRRNVSKEILDEITVIPGIKVSWGAVSQIKAEMLLLKTAFKKRFDYYHIVSDLDLPMMTREKFKDFFYQNKGREFVGFSDGSEGSLSWKNRINYYYPFQNFDIDRNLKKILEKTCLTIQKLLGIDRCVNIEVYKGHNWASITKEFVQFILENETEIYRMFNFSAKADELFLQTLMYKYNPNLAPMYNTENEGSARYIDWTRGTPFEFSDENFEEFTGAFNTHYAFCRKVSIYNSKGIQKYISEKNMMSRTES